MTLLIEPLKFILALGFYIGQIYGKPINAKLDTDVVLHCPYLSTVTHPIIWNGPITIGDYTHNERINKNIPIHDRLSLTGDNNTGEYNLKIHHLTRKDQGVYGCTTVLKGKTVSSEYTVIVLRKPTVLNDSTIYVFGNLESITNVAFLVDCYPKPIVSWINILGGKLGTWNVIDQKGGKFKVQSTVLPSKPNHLGNYKALVRNSEGSEELTVILYGYGKPKVLNGSTIYVPVKLQSISNVTFLVDCYPKPLVSWIQTLGGKLGTWNVMDQKGGKFKVQSTVLQSKPNHLGNYKALVRNSEGSEELTVIMYGYGKPTFLNGSTIYVPVNLESITVVTFLVNCYPKPVVAWTQTLGGKLGTWNVMDQIGGKFKVQSTVLPSKPNHLGNYKALVRNSEGSEELTVILHGYGKPTFLNGSTIYVPVKLESIANATFLVDCYPKPVVSWIHSLGGKLGTWYVMDQIGGKFKVQSTVLPSKPNHLGNYKALVRNSEGSEELTVILYGYGKPKILNGSTIYVPVKLESVTNVTFLVDCYPKPVVSWIQTFEGKVGTWNVMDQKGGKFKVQSTVLQSKPNHLGNYKALVRNSEGSEELTVIMYGYGKPRFLNGSTIYVPVNLESITDVTFLVDCYPKPVVAWIQTLGGKLGTWNVMDQIGGKFRIQSTVLPSKPNHLGNYKALVRNSEGSEELTVILYGYGKPTFFNGSTIYVPVKLESIANVTFLVDCYPKPVVSWIQTLGGILGTWNIIDQIGGKFKVQSTLLPSKPNHLGNYKAVVRNSEGSEELTVILYGYGKPTFLNGSTIYVPVKLESMTSVTFLVDCYPKPVVSWMQTLGGKLDTWNVMDHIGGKFKVQSTVLLSKPNHLGNYKAFVRNSEGSEELTVILYGYGKPTFLNGSTIYVPVKLESIANVTFLVDCYPKPVVSWMQTLGGKLGTWNVMSQIGGKFKVQSTVLPSNPNHLGNYKAFVRNSEGSEELTVILYGYGKPTFLNGSTIYVPVKLASIASVTFLVDCYPKPVVSWIQTLGGKLGTWKVVDQIGNKFEVQSTVLLSKWNHLGNYKALVRNSEGSEELTVILYGYEPVVSIESPNSCNTSQSIKLICTIDGYGTNVWNNTWYHNRGGVYIRSLDGVVTTGVSSLDIRHCDYQDTGTYICSWTSKGVNASASTDLIVYGSPIITDQHVSMQHGVCILSVYFYTSISAVKIKWYYDDKLMDGNLTDISSNVDINLFCYQKLVRTNGMKTYISYDTMDYLNSTINCQIQNECGSTEAVFNQQDFHAIFGGDATSSINKTTEGQAVAFENMYIYVAISAAGILVVMATIVVVGCIYKQGYKDHNIVLNTRNPSLHVTTNETYSNQNDSQNDEIDSTSYQSVTWRQYTLDDSASVLHSTASDDKTFHHSTVSDDKTVDHTPHSYENIQDMEDKHHLYFQIIPLEQDVTCTKDNIS